MFRARPGRRPLARRFTRGAPPGRWTAIRYDGTPGQRWYDLFVPSGLRPGQQVPLVVLLHGCRQTSVRFAEDTGFTAAAQSSGFVLLAPRQEMRHQIQRCWRWYETAHQQRDCGEPALITGMARQVIEQPGPWSIDDRQVYVTGLSAGGAMALILATTYPDVYAAAGVHSATAYRSATKGIRALAAMSASADLPRLLEHGGEMAPVILMHGTSDQVVRPTNSDRIVDQWLVSRESFGLRGLSRIRPIANTRALVIDDRRCIRTRWFTARGRRVLEYWRVDGLAHAWSGGTYAAEFVDPRGPEATRLMCDFFAQHRLPLPDLADEPAYAW